MSLYFIRKKGFTLIELLVVVSIIGALSAVGLILYSNFTDGAKNSVIKTNHRNIVNVVKAEVAKCKLDGSQGEVTRYYRTGARTFAPRKFRCSSGFSNELQVHFLAKGFLDPVIQNTDFYKKWTYNGTRLPNDAGAAWWGAPRKIAKYYPAYWVGKTWITESRINNTRRLTFTSYLMDEKTAIVDILDMPY